MFKKLITLFKLGRKVAKSDILDITSKFQEPPIGISFYLKFCPFLFSKSSYNNLDEGKIIKFIRVNGHNIY